VLHRDQDKGGDHMTERVLLRAEEVANILGIGRTKVFEMLATGELPVVRIGRSVRVPRGELYEWLRERTSGGRAA
jgi:excisionase family DNA binding protein